MSYGTLPDIGVEVERDPGARLFTILGFINNGRTMCRLYSSRPREYPVGGTKDVDQDVASEWIQVAVHEQQPFFGSTIDDLRRVFGDADLIRSLGCGSIINAPIIMEGRTIGALNILDAEGVYTDRSVRRATEIAERSVEAVRDALIGVDG